MRYMVLKHTDAALERLDLWFVADMDHPEHLPRITKKPVIEALDFCARMNQGDKFWDCNGEMTLDEGMDKQRAHVVSYLLEEGEYPITNLIFHSVVAHYGGITGLFHPHKVR